MMHPATPSFVASHVGSRPRALRTPSGRRSWTGRSALSCATDSALPMLVTAGTRRTRVSEMRSPAAGASVAHRTVARPSSPAAVPATRRSNGIPGRSPG